MDIIMMVLGGVLGLLLTYFVVRLFYSILINLINGRKFHHALELEFNKLRLSNMLAALGINKTDYIYRTNVKDIKQQMNSCSACTNTDECDEKLANTDIEITEIEFCNNEADLIEMSQRQKESKTDGE